MITLANSGEAVPQSGGSLSAAPDSTVIANVAGNDMLPRTGAQTGSVHTTGGGQEFTLLLNGHKNTDSFPNYITASFDVTSPSYIRNILNSDPLRFEEAGHLLYASYDVYPTLAVVTALPVYCIPSELISILSDCIFACSTFSCFFVLAMPLHTHTNFIKPVSSCWIVFEST